MRTPGSPVRSAQGRLVRVGLAAGSVVVALAVGLLARRLVASKPQALELIDNTRDVRALLEERGSAGHAPARGGALRRETIPEEDARRLFMLSAAHRRIYDPLTFYRYPPRYEAVSSLEEHPDGEWHLRTNSLGMRRDGEVALEKPDLRVLVTGDSHTEGICNNAETFAGLLELALLERHPESTVEVLNAGKSGYGFYHYLGVLDKFLPLSPDVFVVAVYGGNDLADCLALRHYFDGDMLPEVGLEYGQRLSRAARADGPAVGQVFNQIAYFAELPDEIELGLDTGVRALREMAERCAAANVAFHCVYLPPPSSVEWEFHRDALEPARIAAGLSPASLDRARDIEQTFLERVRDLGVAVIDGRSLFRDPPGPCYWKSDFHLNLEGHRRVAAALLELVEPLLGGR